MESILKVLYTFMFIFFILITYLLCNYIDLSKFKSCYDIDFRTTSCQKYINY